MALNQEIKGTAITLPGIFLREVEEVGGYFLFL